MITACTDSASRQLLFTPTAGEHATLREFGILARGVYFRIVMDESMSEMLRAGCCHSSGLKPIFLTDCQKHTKRIVDLFPAPLTNKVHGELFPDVSEH